MLEGYKFDVVGKAVTMHFPYCSNCFVGRCGVGHGFESEHRLFLHHGACSLQQAEITGEAAHWTIQFVDCCSSLS